MANPYQYGAPFIEGGALGMAKPYQCGAPFTAEWASGNTPMAVERLIPGAAGMGHDDASQLVEDETEGKSNRIYPPRFPTRPPTSETPVSIPYQDPHWYFHQESYLGFPSERQGSI